MASDNRPETTRAEWWRADTATLHARKQELEVLKRRLDAEQNAILAEINNRGVRGCSGHSTLAAMVFEDFLVTDKEAGARADRVLALHPNVVVGGEVVPPLDRGRRGGGHDRGRSGRRDHPHPRPHPVHGS
ncbi:hypothetical protein [Amycolatopsis orientalis]|uniref:hypothetical protein n=1 Tax=Amycolatopsis orientalis TaxID=31958 RepID=UPI002E225D19